MITDNYTNNVYFSSILPERCPVLNASITEALNKRGIRFGYLAGTKDIWCRDYMPIQVENDLFISYRYTPDYLQDERYIRQQTNPEEVLQLEHNQLKSLLPLVQEVDLVIDGGNVVKCDDVVVMTEKVFVENREKTRGDVERILREVFKCDIIFLPWDKKEFFGHSDGIVHYVGKGKILLTNYGDFSKDLYQRFREILESRFNVITLKYNFKRFHARSWSYINFLQVGDSVFFPQLGLDEDLQAIEQISAALPECEVIGIPALEAVRRGGALNCISWNIRQ